MSGPIYDLEFSGEVDAEFVVDYYQFVIGNPLPDNPPEQETADQFNLTAEQVLEIVAQWEADNA